MSFLNEAAKSILKGTGYLKDVANGILTGNQYTYAKQDVPSVVDNTNPQIVSPDELGVMPVDSLSMKKYKANILNASKNVKSRTGLDISPSLIASVFNQESSAGTNKKNYNKSIGEYAWMMGMTDVAKKSLVKNGYTPDLNTEQGVFDASAMYLAQMSKEYAYDAKTNTRTVAKDYINTPADLYTDRYYANLKDPLYPSVKESFPKKLKYYETNYK